MVHIAVLTTDDQLLEMHRASGLKIVQIDAIDFATYARAKDAPSAVVLDLRQSRQLPAGLQEFSREHPNASVILVLPSLDPRMMLDAMRAGVKECLAEPLTPQAIDEALRRAVVGATPEPNGQLFAFVGSKGGVGTARPTRPSITAGCVRCSSSPNTSTASRCLTCRAPMRAWIRWTPPLPSSS